MPGTNHDTAMNLSKTALPPATAGQVSGGRLHGRRGECEMLDRLVADVGAGQSRVLVLRGEPGTGKTALLDYLAQHAAGCRIARVTGVEPEMEMAFAGLHQLCAPFLDRLGHLPDPQRDALRIAFNMQGGNVPDRFAVGMAGLPEFQLGGLADADAQALLDSVMIGPLDERVRNRIIAEARGKPQALLEPTRGLTPGELAGGFGLPSVVPVPSRTEDDYRRRLALLPAATQLLLLIAAVEPAGDPVLVWRAAGHLGVQAEAAEPAAAAGLSGAQRAGTVLSSASQGGDLPGGHAAAAAECAPCSRGYRRFRCQC